MEQEWLCDPTHDFRPKAISYFAGGAKAFELVFTYSPSETDTGRRGELSSIAGREFIPWDGTLSRTFDYAVTDFERGSAVSAFETRAHPLPGEWCLDVRDKRLFQAEAEPPTRVWLAGGLVVLTCLIVIAIRVARKTLNHSE